MKLGRLSKSVEPDYKDMVIDLIWLKVKREKLVIVCAKCRNIIPVNQFKVHLRKIHGFDWWFHPIKFKRFIEKIVRR